jgi:hypothetical protein
LQPAGEVPSVRTRRCGHRLDRGARRIPEVVRGRAVYAPGVPPENDGPVDGSASPPSAPTMKIERTPDPAA